MAKSDDFTASVSPTTEFRAHPPSVRKSLHVVHRTGKVEQSELTWVELPSKTPGRGPEVRPVSNPPDADSAEGGTS